MALLTTGIRASKSMECLIIYNGNNNPEFGVFDWSLDNPTYVLTMTYNDLAPYLHYKMIANVARQVVAVQSRCINIGSQWYNDCFLANQNTHTYDLLYYRYYTSTLATQKDQARTWMHIIETFQDSYIDTSVFGYNSCFYKTDNGAFEYVTPSISTMRDGGAGFTSQFLWANYTWGVKA
jgi:hypothetical protein